MKIEKNIPLPNGSHNQKYPWAKMDVGDSVFFEGQSSLGKASQASRSYGKTNDKKFATRTVDGGVRIWRVE